MKKIKRPITPQDIITLLAQSKAGEAGYPPSLLAARRAEFLKKAASMQSQSGEGPKDTPDQGNSSSSSNARNISNAGKSMGGAHSASQILNGILYAIMGIMVTVILAEVTYLYKDRIRELFLPGREEVVSPATLPPYSSPAASDLPATPSPMQTPTTSLSPLQPTDVVIGNTALPGNAATPVSTQTLPGNRYGNTTRTPMPASTNQSLIATSTKSSPGSNAGQTKTPKP